MPVSAPGPVSHHDVLICGGGLVGLSLALALEQGGLGVAVVDRLPVSERLEPVFDGRASAISWSAWRMLEVLGVSDRIAAAEAITDILVSDARPGGSQGISASPLTLHFGKADAGGVPLGWMVENRHTRLALDAEAATRTRLTRYEQDSVVSFTRSPHCVSARLASGTAIEARLIVGAEGKASPVRDAAGIRTYGWPYRQIAVVATVHLEAGHGGLAHELFLPGGPLALLPLTGNRANIVWSDRSERACAIAALPTADFERELSARLGGRTGQISLEGPVQLWPLRLQLAASFCAERVALCGDAAHVIHPLAGQGLNLGLKDVAALAEVLVEADRLGEDIGSALVLERYARWRRTDTVTLALACEGFTRLFSNDFAPLRLLRTAGMGLVDRIGPLRRMLATQAGGALGDLPRLLRGESLA
jgi:2-octaprenyl-6-methoxyphenol hydroxylase